MSDLVSVVVLNWNGRRYLDRCLRSLEMQTYSALETIVVDNGSTDDSVAWVAAQFPYIPLIKNSANLGFAAASNQGVRSSRGPYVALLNNDAWAAPDWIAQLVAAIETDSHLGMVASQMLFASQPEVINSTGICVDRSGITWDRLGGEARQPSSAPLTPVLGPCAGAGLYRRAMLEEVGLFDEDFFAYLEDVDLAWRANWLGWRAVYTPAACVYHVHSATSIEGSSFKTYYLARNKVWVLAKNYPMPQLLLYLPLIMFYELLSFGYSLVRGRGLSAARGRWAGLRKLGAMWAKRPQHNARVDGATMFSRLHSARWPWKVIGQIRHIVPWGPSA